MKILIVGSGGREHTLAWKAAQSERVTEVILAPGNIGIAAEPKCRLVDISSDDIARLRRFALDEKVDLTIVGPEAPLVGGLTDAFAQAGLRVFGPSQKASQLEGSKAFTKRLLKKYDIPSGDFQVFDDYDEASAYLKSITGPIVVKADGLAAGKGVYVCKDRNESLAALDAIMKQRAFGDAGDVVVVEECLVGEEASFIAFTDGKTVVPLAGSQDHKPAYDNDEGPNTGGMGAYSPAPVITPEMHERIMNRIMIPVVQAMEEEGAPYLGFLYAGLMIADGVPKVLEFNVRMGDPEAQPLLFRMNSDMIPFMTAAVDGTLAGMEIEWAPEHSVCVVMASGGYPGSYEKGKVITGLGEASAMEGVKVFHAGTGHGPDGIVTNGGRVLGVTAKAPGIAQAIDQVYKAVEKISWEKCHYRKDIGKKALNRD
ncbi:MAG: phosphoribosylamine--glycine ligase [Desulfomonilaceae bacterium]|nr:phosphoribosylamine--glycine ligase [Desulfomonilaceae bacterium]